MDQVNIIESPVETLHYRIVRPLRVRLSKERGATSLRVDMNPLTETAASVYEPVRAEVVDRHAPVSRKRLCRVVFKDATCTSVDALGTLGEVMDTIYGALTRKPYTFSVLPTNLTVHHPSAPPHAFGRLGTQGYKHGEHHGTPLWKCDSGEIVRS